MVSKVRRIQLVGVVCFGALMVGACGGGGGAEEAARSSSVPLAEPTASRQAVAKEDLGSLWPFTVDHGTIECRAGVQAVFVAPDGKAFALNDKAEEAGVAGVEPLRAKGAGGDKVSLGAVRSKALRLCEFAG
ncbi:DUF2511 domain-containing protein [Nocardia sp. NPDC006044]|uniref:DUF2511 domain-containing protein n=1 Tax=Nocardia sp. NPDC006044 TaxID=3364306 RepID=UPI00368A5095